MVRTFIWKDKEMSTFGDIMNAVTACETKEQAIEFRDAYRENSPEHADANLGYLMGYLSHESAVRYLEWLEVSHPIFGSMKERDVTPQNAFEAGAKAGSS